MANNIYEFQLSAEILPFLEYIPSIEEGKQFIKIYIAAMNRERQENGDDPIDYQQTLRFIIMVDPRFSNML